jgi:type I restriction enzyme S subunit
MPESRASMSEWRHVPAGKIARQRREIVRLEPGTEYRTMGVRWHGKGAYDRGTVTTETVKASSLYRARAGDFTFNRIDTQRGAFDVVPAELDGALATNEFPLYEVSEEDVDARFLLLNFQRPEVLHQIDAVRAGSEGRARWKEADFEAWIVHVPPLPLQVRIVEVIGAVDDEISALDAEAGALEAVYRAATSLLWRTAEGDEAEFRFLGDVMHLDIARIPMDEGTTYYLAGVLNAGKGLADKGVFDGADTEYTAMNVLRENQVVMRKLTAWEGPITVVPAEFDGFVASNEFPTFTLVGDIAPGWMKHVCRTPRLWAEMQSRVVGTVQRRKRLNPDQLLSVALPVPSRAEQEEAAEVLDAMDGQAAALRAEADRLCEARAVMLSDLLTRTIDIESAELEV